MTPSEGSGITPLVALLWLLAGGGVVGVVVGVVTVAGADSAERLPAASTAETV